MSTPLTPADDDQFRYLDASKKKVKEQAFYMKRAMDANKLETALEHAMEMLKELKTNLLSPKNYYELYMKAMDELREFEEFIISLQKSGTCIADIYEQVQNCVHIVPRLYLLSCVGSVYITSQEAPAKDVLRDMVEMIKGVQHPMRGLFLRNYLTQVTKNKLPDIGSPYEGVGGTVQDAYQFVLQNFAETNRLWVRMQTQGPAKDKKKREKERLDLRILVGTNLVRLSQLEGLEAQEYESFVLPKILDEVIMSKDTIAQSYLMDCIIQVFPTEFHLVTLEPFLAACAKLKEKVNVRTILESMIERLTTHFSSDNTDAGSQQQQLAPEGSFTLFSECVKSINENRPNMSLVEALKLQTLLVNFALKCFPTRTEYVSLCLKTSSSIIEKTDFIQQCSNMTLTHTQAKNEATTTAGSADPAQRTIHDTIAQMESLLAAPLSVMSMKVLDIPEYTSMISLLPWDSWKSVSASLVRSIVVSGSVISDVDSLERLFGSITPLLKDAQGAPPSVDEDGRDLPVSQSYKDEQILVAKLVHLIKNPDTDVMLRMLVMVRTYFSSGGVQRLQYTLTPLVFSALSLARKIVAREKAAAAVGAEGAEADPEGIEKTAPQYSARKAFQFIMEIASMLAGSSSHAETALKIYLYAAQAADECKYNAIAYEFTKEALLLYENEISDSKAQIRVLTTIIGSMLQCKNLLTEDYEALITKVAQYANKLLKKPDQSRMVTLCAHLFDPRNKAGTAAAVPPEGEEAGTCTYYSEPDRVLECMQRSLKVASTSNTSLFVEILDRYVYFFEKENPAIKVSYLSGLVALINEQVMGAGAETPPSAAVEAHYKNIIEYISMRQRTGGSEASERFREIQLQ